MKSKPAPESPSIYAARGTPSMNTLNSLNSPSMDASDLNSPSMNASDLNSPSMNASDLNSPLMNASNLNSSSMNASNLNSPSLNAPKFYKNKPSPLSKPTMESPVSSPLRARSASIPSRSFDMSRIEPLDPFAVGMETFTPASREGFAKTLSACKELFGKSGVPASREVFGKSGLPASKELLEKTASKELFGKTATPASKGVFGKTATPKEVGRASTLKTLLKNRMEGTPLAERMMATSTPRFDDDE